MIFVATLAHVGERIPVLKMIRVEADDIDVAASKAIDTTAIDERNDGWMVVAIRDPSSIDASGVL